MHRAQALMTEIMTTKSLTFKLNFNLYKDNWIFLVLGKYQNRAPIYISRLVPSNVLIKGEL